MTKTPADQPDDADAQPRKAAAPRLFFTPVPWWAALTSMQSGIAAGEIIQKAVASAAGLPGFLSICIVCEQPFTREVGPGAVLLAEPFEGDAMGSIALICQGCWRGTWDEALMDAVHRQFGVRPGDLQPLHRTEGNA
jgi:hypothetical protein